MNTDIGNLIIAKFTLSPDERSYLEKLDGSMGGTKEEKMMIYSNLMQFYMTKQNEEVAKSTDKASKTMSNLTWVIAIAAALQAFATVFQAIAVFK